MKTSKFNLTLITKITNSITVLPEKKTKQQGK